MDETRGDCRGTDCRAPLKARYLQCLSIKERASGCIGAPLSSSSPWLSSPFLSQHLPAGMFSCEGVKCAYKVLHP